MRPYRYSLLILLLLFVSASGVNADTLYLKNGRQIEGLIKNEDQDYIELEVSGGMVKFQKQEIERIKKTDYQESVSIRRKWEKQKSETQEKLLKRKEEEKRKPRAVEFSGEGHAITVNATLNHKVEVSLLLDTGASLVILKKNIAEQLGIDLEKAKPDSKLTVADGRQINAKYILLESVKVENAEAEGVGAAIMLEEAGNTGFGDGLLGMSFLKKFNFKIDYTDGKLILEKR